MRTSSLNSGEAMDLSLFQIGMSRSVKVAHDLALPRGERLGLNISLTAEYSKSRKDAIASSANLDLLRSFAVTLVVGFHLAKFFNFRFAGLRITDFGLLGVMLFFVHTTLVLMFSLERQSARPGAPLFLPFIVRRCFRIYPLALAVVLFVFLFHIPSDLQFGKFNLLHQSASNLLANLFLVQNVTQQKANPGILWSLPLELQMYLALPALFLFATRVRWWGMVAFWWFAVAAWYAIGFSTGMLPLSEGLIRSPAEAFLKFTRFAPCFLPGLVAYKLWHKPRAFPAFCWPVFLAGCCALFVWVSGSRPIEAGWFICFAIGLGVCFFREIRSPAITRLTKQIARYSYGIYLLHYFAIWVAFVVFRRLNVVMSAAIFLAVLVSLSVLLYHAIEAPLIGVGVKVSEKSMRRRFVSGLNRHPIKFTPQIFSDETGSL
jgi:peptidoglycan/LPS O-acetylase OafA/YrhL